MVNVSDVDEQVPTRTEDDLEALVEKTIKNAKTIVRIGLVILFIL